MDTHDDHTHDDHTHDDHTHDDGRRDHGTIEEPANSTVDDWLGQKVERDRALAERLLAETGDFDEARRRFEQEREGPRPESLPTEERRT